MHKPHIMQSISELHRLLEIPAPAHPLVSVVNMADVGCTLQPGSHSIVYNFYSVCAKKGFNGKLRYGQTYYDFDNGVMTFFGPGQVTAAEVTADQKLTGWWLLVHPDFLRSHPLGARMKDYSFFSYAANEALHLSEREDEMLAALIAGIDREHRAPIDAYSQDVLLSQIELLLNYCNRFYNRQFITRRSASSELLTRFEAALDAHFDGQARDTDGLPTVQQLAAKLAVSPSYLSDMLRSLTGQNAQQHIHNKLIERSKTLLSTTALSVGEIAYRLGFSYPQSFNRLFKKETELSPGEYRETFN